jgi:hypothetical protein
MLALALLLIGTPASGDDLAMALWYAFAGGSLTPTRLSGYDSYSHTPAHPLKLPIELMVRTNGKFTCGEALWVLGMGTVYDRRYAKVACRNGGAEVLYRVELLTRVNDQPRYSLHGEPQGQGPAYPDIQTYAVRPRNAETDERD